MSRPGGRIRARRLAFGLSTVLGLKSLGFFIPYRYARGVVPRPYPALEPLFLDAEPAIEAVLDSIERYAPEFDRIIAGAGPARFDQDWFPRLDAATAYAMVRTARPDRIVEIGSGHSTRFMVQAVRDGGLATDVIAIDPTPRASLAGLGIHHVASLLDAADPTLFDGLGPSGILFVDSSHVAMPGTDLDRIVGDILPRLPVGTLVHLHDILLPDVYPDAWRPRGYNESIVVAALLQGGGYRIEAASHWTASRRPEAGAHGILGRLPLLPGALETSLWLRKR